MTCMLTEIFIIFKLSLIVRYSLPNGSVADKADTSKINARDLFPLFRSFPTTDECARNLYEAHHTRRAQKVIGNRITAVSLIHYDQLRHSASVVNSCMLWLLLFHQRLG
ncbi:hypothetical protein CEXT_308511 [Caerostris extrusa]|uniref:Uncharacterized protein n=1 Tax=Caerostris extrusa TaxID=172846 RepID=A0AAV4YBB0_CAEEX|nr:hypothetical protein CEXT_308511 [Caerostris extrusa]